jgi:tRNA1(Val) A37 N6-methylase TrmN6
MERLRIVLEFSKNKKEDLELYRELIIHSSPAAHVKDILRGVSPLPTLDNKKVQE